jgi:NADH:ubiquinone oxidoreductase subunit F (NADH-binding)
VSRRRSFQKLIRTSIFPVALPFFIAILVGLTIATILRILLAPGDAVVVQVLPIGKNDVVTVQVEGAVRQPGVYALPTGSTVGDAVQQAGGPTEGVELAAGAEETAVVDGQFIVIPESASASA